MSTPHWRPHRQVTKREVAHIVQVARKAQESHQAQINNLIAIFAARQDDVRTAAASSHFSLLMVYVSRNSVLTSAIRCYLCPAV
jgi:hypothetical protein